MSFDQNGNNRFGVTVIGTRNPTPYGRAVTEMITADLADHQVMIISGMARGIDSIAHRTALKRHGLTIAVLGNGPDLPYPPENADLLQEISRKGLIISEHPPGTAPRKQHFPARNRILSGLSDAIAVIEASRDSGSLITANFAGDQGRDVYAVPGSILSPFSQGCNQLIREGAEILCSASDILQRLPVGVMQQELACRISPYADHPDMIMNPDLFHALVGGPLSLAELTGILERSVAETAALLTRQELDGYISCEKGRYSLTAQGKICI